jgi:hypothetical protein
VSWWRRLFRPGGELAEAYDMGGPGVILVPDRVITEETASKLTRWSQGVELMEKATDPAPGLHEIVTGGKPLPTFAELRAKYPLEDPANECDTPEVDFRAALGDDSAAWTVKSRLEVVLGRPYLATRIADQLDGETGAMLADRLEVLAATSAHAAVSELTAHVEAAVTERIASIRAERFKAEEVARERFARHSRFD